MGAFDSAVEEYKDGEYVFVSLDNYHVAVCKKTKDTCTNEGRGGVIDPKHALFRANQLLVVAIINKQTGEKMLSVYEKYNEIEYNVGSIVISPFDEDIEKVHGAGIQYHNSPEPALFKNGHIVVDHLRQGWFDSGALREECFFDTERRLHLQRTCWYETGEVSSQSFFCHGQMTVNILYTKNGNILQQSPYSEKR